MKSVIRKITAVGAAAVMAFGTITAASALTISSDRIVAKVSSYSMALYNIEGNRLLFTSQGMTSSSIGGTSRNYISVDGYTAEIYTTDDVADAENACITGTGAYRGIDYTRTVSLLPNTVNGGVDVAEIKLTITNNTEATHQVGGRIFLDTMLESNDDAPFRVEGYGALTYCTQYEGLIPETFQAFDNLSNPKLVATGTFAKGDGKPDVVQFTNYGANYTTLIPPCYSSEKIGDSAVNAIWKEAPLAAGESLVFATYYGLGELDVQQSSELKLGATRNQSAFSISEDGNAYEPVAVTGYISNSGLIDLSGVALYIDLPNGVTALHNGVGYPTLKVGEEQQQTWYLEATPSPEERTVTVTVNAESAETGKVDPVVYTFTIPAIEGAAPIPEEEPTTEPVTTVDVTAAPTTVPDATSATKPAATKDDATKDQATKDQSSNGTVKTGEAVPAAVILVTLLAGVGVVYFKRRKEN